MILSIEKLIELFKKKELIPIGIVAVSIYCTVFFVRLDDTITAHAASISEVQKAQVDYNKTATRLDKRVALIQQKLKIKVNDDRD